MTGVGTVLRAVVVALIVATTAAGCSLAPEQLPLPGSRVSNGYRLNVEFESVLNLPAKSRVLLNGTKVGVVDRTELAHRDGRTVAVAVLSLDRSAVIARSARAEIRQGTLLGDFYVALVSEAGPDQADNDNSAGNYTAGQSIPLRQTSVTPEVESLLGGVAALANGGVITKLQQTMEDANAAFPADPADRDHGIEILRALIHRLAGSRDEMASILGSIAAISGTLDRDAAKLGFSLDVGPKRVGGAVSAFLGLSRVLQALGPNVIPIGNLVVPRKAQIQALIGVINPLVATATRLDSTARSDMDRLAQLINGRIIPLALRPNIDIVDVTAPDGQAGGASKPADGDITKTVIAVLRAIGAVK